MGRADARYYSWALVLFVVGYMAATYVHGLPRGTEPANWEIAIFRDDLGVTVTMDFEEYVLGVVAAEMPATFHIEALKAQAVAARTYALHLVRQERELPQDPAAVLSTDFSTGQAWTDRAAFYARWGEAEAAWRWERLEYAVRATRGLVATYAGEPILAAYHSSSGGHTENSENYWSGALPYLRGVPDPFDAESPHRAQSAEVPIYTVLAALSIPTQSVLEGEAFVAVEERFPSGRVRTVRLGDQRFTGRQVREGLQLRSSLFEVEEVNGRLRFRLEGNGHGVGMSQYGADGMARSGYTYDSILRYYYTGIDITRMYD